jgi:CelD/BcsL family acetyltransferase involved in cellulose biosynthesis
MLAMPETGAAVAKHGQLRIAQADVACLPSIEEWRDLGRSAAEPNPFFEHWFLKPALAHLVDTHIIRIAEYRVDGQLCGLFPLSVRDKYGRSPARNVGNWAHYQCFLGTPLIRLGHERAFWCALIAELDAADWSGSLMSFAGLDPDGVAYAALIAVAHELGRPAPIVHRFDRALLSSSLDPDAYLQTNVRSKKRKEWRRLDNRLAEMGNVTFAVLDCADDLSGWCEEFLALEAAGWKGARGAALANTDATRAFFLNTLAAAFSEGLLDLQRLDLDGRAIAMLVNFLTPPGSWSFKIAYDEQLARFSPGVMIELRNLDRVLANSSLDWMDSCAVENHPMIDSLWAERRTIVQVSVPLSGMRRRAVYATCRAAETGSAAVRRVLST